MAKQKGMATGGDRKQQHQDQHPLLIGVVLETMFQYVPHLFDLKNARLVCSSWKSGSLKQWRQAGVLVLLQSQQRNKKPGAHAHPCSMEELHRLMMMEAGNNDGGSNSGFQLTRRPFQGIRLSDWKFYGDADGGGGAFWEEHMFKEKPARFVTYLHLDHCSFRKGAVLDELLARALPLLKRLVLSSCKVGRREEPSELGGSAAELLVNQRRQNTKHSLKILEIRGDPDLEVLKDYGLVRLLYGKPNLEELILHARQRPVTYITHTTSFLNAITTTKYLNNKNAGDDGSINIRKLDIMNFFTDASLDFLYDWSNTKTILDLQLEELAVDVGATTSELVANTIFSTNLETLKVLRAFRAPIRSGPPYITVPFSQQMLALEELHLWGNLTTNLAFLQFTPSLQALVLKRDCYDKRDKLESLLKKQYLLPHAGDLVESTLEAMRQRGTPSEEALTVTTVAHLELDYNISAKSIPTLAKWLPNVKTLKMVLTNNESLEAVSRAWPGLTELELLFGSRVDDDGITYLQRFLSLKKFKSNAYCNEGLLSSSSVNRVLLKMRTLKSLEMCVSSKMSVKAERDLSRAIAHVKVIRNYDDNPDHDNYQHECCDRMEFLRESVKPIKPVRGAPSNSAGTTHDMNKK